MAMISHIAATVGKGVSLRGDTGQTFITVSSHCPDSKLSQFYQSIKHLQGPPRFRTLFVTGVLDLKHFDHWKVEPDLISFNTASATWLCR